MLPYLSIYAIVIICFFFNNKKVTNFHFFLYILPLILFLGLRDMIGGYDVYVYGQVYELPDVRLMFAYPFFETGFKVYYFLLQLISTDRYFMFFISSILIILGQFHPIRKYSEMFYISAFVFFCKFYIMDFVYLRQGLTMALVWTFAVPYILKRNLWMYLLIMFIAFSLHKSSIIFFPLYFIANRKLSMQFTGILMLFVIIVAVTPLSGILLSFISEASDNEKFAGYAQKSGSVNIFYLLEAFVLLVIYFFLRPLVAKENKVTNLVLNGLLLYCIVTFFSLTNASFIRFQWYYLIFMTLAIPVFIKYIKSRQKKILAKGVVLFYFTALSLRLLITFDGGDLMPYKTIFQDFDRKGKWEKIEYRNRY